MNLDVFDNIYYWLHALFGEDLWMLLAGQASTDTDHFPTIFIVSIALAIALCAFYYFNKSVLPPSKFNTKLGWLVIFLVAAFLSWAVGFSIAEYAYNVSSLTYTDPETSEEITLDINQGNLIVFGLVNALYSSVIYFFASLLFKRWSANYHNQPF
jgi:hypothetical protein